MNKSIHWLRLLACVAIPVVSGSLVGFLTVDSISQWYASLQKPSFNPPNFIFGPVWTLLYTLMGIGLYLVLNRPPSAIRQKALTIFFLQLILNLSWSIVFFNLQSPFAAFLVIIALWIMILLMILTFFKVSRLAAYLQIPYLLWVSFAALLNLNIWLLNQ